jgi:hypothetical protein
MIGGMDEDDLVASAVLGKRPSPTGWIRANCPLCVFTEGKDDHKCSLGFSVTSYRFECYRCGATGKLTDPPEAYDVEAMIGPGRAPPPRHVEPPEGFFTLAGDTSIALADARDYLLHGRANMTEQIIANAGVGACVSGRFAGYVIVPIFDHLEPGKWRWFVARRWVKKCERPYLYPFGARRGLVYNEAALEVVTDEPLLVVEGCFDAIPHAPNAIAVLGKTTEEHFARLTYARRPVVFVPDGDAWRDGEHFAMRLRAAGVRAGAIKLAPKEDPDEIDPAVLRAVAYSALEGC